MYRCTRNSCRSNGCRANDLEWRKGMRQITETTPAVQQVTEEGLPLPGVYEIDPAHTNVTFSARHLMVSKVRGRFTGFSGTVHVADSVEDSRVEASIDVATIDTGMPMR